MSESRTLLRRVLSPNSPSDAGLPPDLLAKARRRLAGLAGVLGTLSVIAILLNATVFARQVGAATQPQHFVAVGLALTVIAAALSKRVSVATALDVGLAYDVGLCWLISFSAQHAALEMLGRPPEITWTSMVIVIFPMIVPVPPARLLGASILAAVSAPVSLLVLNRVGGYPLTADAFISVSVAPAFAVVLAYVGARMIYAIGLDVSKARQLGAYQLEARLGAGGMGEVWRASHRLLARPAAVKLIAPQHLGGDSHSVRVRFEHEAQATALLRSPHTIEVYDYGHTSDGSFYYVMELLDGLDLHQLVSKHGPVSASRAVHILSQACHSLGEAHSAALVHRDVKPANIFVCHYGRDFDFVKVLDFGLVKQQHVSDEHALTQRDQLVGTPAYMAPEALRGSSLDGRVDLYALGCVGYWLLTGCQVFEAGSPMEMAVKHIHESPAPPSTRSEMPLPADLEAVIMACLEKEPGDRPASAEVLAERLNGCQVDRWTNAEARKWWQDHHVAEGHSASLART